MSRIRVEESYLAAAYQVAGARLLAADTLTEGQRDRLTELLLNVLSDPQHYTANIIHDLMRLALQP